MPGGQLDHQVGFDVASYLRLQLGRADRGEAALVQAVADLPFSLLMLLVEGRLNGMERWHSGNVAVCAHSQRMTHKALSKLTYGRAS